MSTATRDRREDRRATAAAKRLLDAVARLLVVSRETQRARDQLLRLTERRRPALEVGDDR
jgi:hypothetical protein